MSEPLTELEFYVPVKTVSELNRRDHWRTKDRRRREQQEAAYYAYKGAAKGGRVALPCVVRFLRIGPRKLDSDNLASAMKAVRDTIAQCVGVDDGSESIRFEYDQVAIGERSYNVKVSIKSL